MNTKKIEKILFPPRVHMVGDGFRVHTYFPSYDIGESRMSPFFLMDYGAKFNFPPATIPRGVGVHPHRGFETVTVCFRGAVSHHDSAGNSGVIYEGDVQWMTAGSGVLHKEYHEAEFSRNGGIMQMVQLWVNLPRKDKMTNPKYQAITHDMFGKFPFDHGKGLVNVIAGEFRGMKGAANTFSPVHLYNIQFYEKSELTLSTPANFNTCLIVIDGTVGVNNHPAEENQLVLFENQGTDFKIKCNAPATVLILSGEPLNEPIYAYGPFLMSTEEEIRQAYDDFNKGMFGYLKD
jgi:redox-sensitive bicupin YhaK (pirin superfamily)